MQVLMAVFLWSIHDQIEKYCETRVNWLASDYAAEGLHNGGHLIMDTAWRHVKTGNTQLGELDNKYIWLQRLLNMPGNTSRCDCYCIDWPTISDVRLRRDALRLALPIFQRQKTRIMTAVDWAFAFINLPLAESSRNLKSSYKRKLKNPQTILKHVR